MGIAFLKKIIQVYFFSNQIFTNLTIGIFWMYVILTYKTNVSSPVVGSPQRGLEQRLYVFLWIKKTPKGYFRDFHKVRPFILCKSEPFIVICKEFSGARPRYSMYVQFYYLIHIILFCFFFQVKMLLCPVKLDQYLLPKFSGIVMALKSWIIH